MQAVQLSSSYEYHLKQRNKIETSQARSIHGFLSRIYASLCEYQLTHQNKPMI